VPSRTGPILAAVLGVIVAAGCGSGSTAATAAASPSSAPVSAAPEASAEAASAMPPSAASSAAAPDSPGASGGGAGLCPLFTVDDATAVFGGTGITEQGSSGPPDTCEVDRTGAPIAVLVYTAVGGRLAFDALSGSGDATAVPGIGDKAFSSASQQLLVVAKGDGMVAISVTDANQDSAGQMDLAKKIGKIAAGRM